MIQSQKATFDIQQSSGSKKNVEVEIADLRKITEVVKNRYGYDFSDYAKSSFRRRIQRVIEMFQFNSVQE